MAEHEVIYLDPADLTHKFGFGDGDIGGYMLLNWLPNSVWSEQYNKEDGMPTGMNMYLSGRSLLLAVIEEKLLPALTEGPPSELVYVTTSHNPMRLFPVVSDEEDENDDKHETELLAWLESLEPVQIDMTEIASIADRIFPSRTRGWLAMYEALFYQYHIIDQRSTTMVNLPTWRRNVNASVLPLIVNELAETWTEEELLLAADLLEARTDNINSFNWSDVTDTLNSARLVMQ